VINLVSSAIFRDETMSLSLVSTASGHPGTSIRKESMQDDLSPALFNTKPASNIGSTYRGLNRSLRHVKGLVE